MIGKTIRIGLVALLSFFVCAPLIVGVYDATNGARNFDASIESGARGIVQGADGGAIRIQDQGLRSDDVSVLQGGEEGAGQSGSEEICYGYSSYTDGTSSVNNTTDGRIGSVEINSNGSGLCDQYENSSSSTGFDSLSAFYRGDSSVCDLLRSGDAHLIYSFADGSTLDFGNPYILDWTDVPQPDDYDEIVALADSEGDTIFTPEKAYAGPISWLAKKLNMLAIKSGYWKSFQNALYSMLITGASALGMSAPAIAEFEAKIMAEAPAAMELVAKEGVIASEEDITMLMSDAVMTASQRGYSVAEMASKMPSLIEEEAASINATGQLLGGGSSNFMNALYDLLATNQVSAEFIASNADFFTSFFGWLGADLTEFVDIPNVDGDLAGTISFNGVDVPINVSSDDLTMGVSLPSSVLSAGHNAMTCLYSKSDGSYSGGTCDGSRVADLNLEILENGKIRFKGNSFRVRRTVSSWSIDSYTAWYFDSPSSDSVLIAPNVNLRVSVEKGPSFYDLGFYDCATGEWSGENGLFFPAGFSGVFDGQVIGQDAQYDDAGNITDYGNVTVPNVYAPDYVAPGSYGEALNQMHADATVDNPAHVDSPSFSQPDTPIKDWVDNNQTPKPEPSEESSQDDFKIKDLESVFPYCIPWDLYYLLAQFAAEPQAPSFTWHFDFLQAGEYDFTVDLAQFEFAAQVLRTCETVAFCIGLALLTRNIIRG